MISPRASRFIAMLPGMALAGGLAIVLLAVDVTPFEVARYAAYVCWAIVLPGTLIYRAFRRTPHTLIEDLAMGAATGFALELGAMAIFATIGLRDWLPLWPLAVMVAFLLVPRLRTHWRPVGYMPVRPAWAWSVAACALFAATYSVLAVPWQRDVPPTGEQGYFPDFLYMLSMTSEAKHHFPPHLPQVASELLNYHWFSYAHEGIASQISEVPTDVAFFRLALPVICVASVVLIAVVGWRVSDRPWTGPIAAFMLFVAGELTLVEGMGRFRWGSSFTVSVWASHSLAYGWVFTLPLIAVAAGRLSRSPSRIAPYGKGAWVLLTLFALAAVGAKSPIVPLALAGVALVGAVELIRYRRVRLPVILVGGILLCALVFAAAVLFRFNTHGMDWNPGAVFASDLTDDPQRPWWKALVLGSELFAAYVIYLLLRLAGVGYLAWRGRREWGTTAWFLAGGMLAGLASALLLDHPTWGEQWFLRCAFPFGLILSAWGFALLIERCHLSARSTAAALGMGTALVVGAFALPTSVAEDLYGGRPMWPILGYGIIVGLLLIVIVVAWTAARRFASIPASGALLVGLAIVLSAGIPATLREIRNPVAFAAPYNHFVVTGADLEAAAWLRANSSPTELLATNRHCQSYHAEEPCASGSFWLAAFAERRELVGSWGYAPRTQEIAQRQGINPAFTRFWDQALLAANDSAFSAPAADGLAQLRDIHGVRWLVVERVAGRESPELTHLADLRFDNGRIAIYRLRG